jgi:hypothetical protein
MIQPSHIANGDVFPRRQRTDFGPNLQHSADGARQIAVHGIARTGSLEFVPPAKTKSALETMEHLALLKRWFYRGTRTGESLLRRRQR